MRVLVTGSLGVLGQPLVAELRNRGHEVWGCDLRHSGDRQYVRGDIANWNYCETIFDEARPEVVYHLAAEFGRLNGEIYSAELWRTAMEGTRNIMACCDGGGARLLFASSSEVYGNFDADWLTEDLTDDHVIFHPNEYALSKWANERQILAYQARHDLDAVRLRFFNAYGPGEAFHPYRSVVALFCHKALNGEPLPVFEGYHRTFMHIDDFIPTLANVCEADLHHSVYNIGGEDYRSVLELAAIVLDAVGVQADHDSIELIPEDTHNVRAKRPDIERARLDLSHAPTIRLEQGVPDTLDWMRAAEDRAGVPR